MSGIKGERVVKHILVLNKIMWQLLFYDIIFIIYMIMILKNIVYIQKGILAFIRNKGSDQKTFDNRSTNRAAFCAIE